MRQKRFISKHKVRIDGHNGLSKSIASGEKMRKSRPRGRRSGLRADRIFWVARDIHAAVDQWAKAGGRVATTGGNPIVRANGAGNLFVRERHAVAYNPHLIGTARPTWQHQ